MRNFKVVLIVLTLFFVGMAISDASKNKPDDSGWYAQIWDYAAETQNSNQLWSVFKAIELKDEKEYIPALDRFLTIRRRNTPHRAQAIYTLSKLGSKYIEEDFNLLLEDKSHFETQLWPREMIEKHEALKYMSELDHSLSQNAIDEIKTDIAKVLDQKYPKYAIDLIAGLKLNGIELTDKEKRLVATECSAKWHNINPESLKQSGIQLDWELMIETAHLEKNKKHFFRTRDYYKLMLTASDEKLREKYAVELANDPDPDRLKKTYQRIMAASLGDENAVNEIIDNMNLEYILYSEPVINLLPDKLLLEMLAWEDKDPRNSGSTCILELLNRGYEKEVNAFLDKNEKITREFDYNCKDLIEQFKKDPMISPYYEIIRPVYPISRIDVDRYLNILWDLFEKESNNQCSYFLAKRFIQHFELSRYMDEFPNADDWVVDNPEKLTEIIKTILEAEYSRDVEHNRRTATLAMLRLPDSTFKKNFSKLDAETMTSSAYLVGNHFKAKWAYKQDQQRFYEKYGRKRN